MADLSRKERIPTKNTKNTRGNMRGRHERITQTNKNNHTCARSSKHKEIHDPNPTKDDT